MLRAPYQRPQEVTFSAQDRLARPPSDARAAPPARPARARVDSCSCCAAIRASVQCGRSAEEQAHLAGERRRRRARSARCAAAATIAMWTALWASATSPQAGFGRAQTAPRRPRPRARRPAAARRCARAPGGRPRARARRAARRGRERRAASSLATLAPRFGSIADQPLGRELAQRRAHRVARDAVALGQLALGEPLARRPARPRGCARAGRPTSASTVETRASWLVVRPRSGMASPAGPGALRRVGVAAGAQREQRQAAPARARRRPRPPGRAARRGRRRRGRPRSAARRA